MLYKDNIYKSKYISTSSDFIMAEPIRVLDIFNIIVINNIINFL